MGSSIDSLQQVLRDQFARKDRVALTRTYLALGDTLAQAYRHQEALESYQAGLKAAREIRSREKQFLFLNQIGYMYYWLDNYPEALIQLENARKLAAAVSVQQRIKNLSRIAEVYIGLGDYENALAAQLRALRLSEKTQDLFGLGNAHRVLSSIYWHQQNYEQAMEELKEALHAFEAHGEPKSIYTCMAAMAAVHTEQGRNYRALRVAQRSLAFADSIDYRYGQAFSTGMIGAAYQKLDDIPRAKQYILSAIEQFRALKIEFEAADFALLLADIYLMEGRDAQGLDLLHDLAQKARDISSLDLQAKAYQRLADAYAAQGDHQTALRFQRQFSQVRDSLLNEKRVNEIARLEAQYKLEKRSQQLQLQDKTHQLTRDQWYLFGYSVILLAVATGWWWAFQRFRGLRQEQDRLKFVHHHVLKSHDELVTQNRELTSMSDMFARELQRVINTLSPPVAQALQPGQVAPSEQLPHPVYQEGLNRLTRLHAGLQLYRAFDVPSEPEEVNLGEAVALAIERLPGHLRRKARQIRVKDLPTLTASRPKMIQLFEQLISNAIKFTPDAPAELLIQGYPQKDHFLISVKDKGMGIPESQLEHVFELFYCGTSQQEGNGLGLAIAKKIVEQHQGKIWIESTVSTGTIVYLSFPI